MNLLRFLTPEIALINQSKSYRLLLIQFWSGDNIICTDSNVYFIGVCLSDNTSDSENLPGVSLPDEPKAGRGRLCDCRRRGLRRSQRGDGEEHNGPDGRRRGPPRPNGQEEGPEEGPDGARRGPPRPEGQMDGPREGPGAGPREGEGDGPDGTMRGPPKPKGEGPREGPDGKGMRPPRPGRGSGEPGDRPKRCRCGGRGGRAHGGPGPRGERNPPKDPEQKVCFVPSVSN